MHQAPFVIFRVAKLKSIGEIAGSRSHQLRERATDNADQELMHKNIVIIEPPPVNQIMNVICEKLGGKKPHKNAVLASDILISASPEYFRPNNTNQAGSFEVERLNAWRSAVEPWIKNEFPDAIAVILHLDEATPHYTITDIPVNRRTGRLSHREKFGGDNRKDGLSVWQTKAVEPVAKLGIVRGISGSQAKHNDIKRYYSAVSAPTPELPQVMTRRVQKLPEPTLLEQIPFTDANKIRINKEGDLLKKQKQRLAEISAQNLAAVKGFSQLAQKAKSVDLLIKQNQELKATLVKKETELSVEKEQSKKIRLIPLAETLSKIYNAVELSHPESNNSIRVFKLPDGRQISISNDKFIREGNKDNKGSINLVMYLDNLDYKNSLRLLIDFFEKDTVNAENSMKLVNESEKAIDAIANEPLLPPVSTKNSWPTVSNWLRSVCGVPQKLVTRLHKFGLVFSDRNGNAIFPRAGGGAYVHGTGAIQFERIYGARTSGIFAIPGKAIEGGVYLVKDPMDAIAIKSMNPDAVAISTTVEQLESVNLKQILEGSDLNSGQLFAAFGNERIGQKMALTASRIFDALRFAPPAKFECWAQAVKEDQSLISREWFDEGLNETKPFQPTERSVDLPTPKF